MFYLLFLENCNYDFILSFNHALYPVSKSVNDICYMCFLCCFQQEEEEEDVSISRLHFYNNKEMLSQLMGKNNGIFYIIDEASRQLQNGRHIIGRIEERNRGIYVKAVNSHEFTITHYTGKLTYDANEIIVKNRDFLPPEIIDAMRSSSCDIIKQIFTNKLTRSGNLITVHENCIASEKTLKNKWGALVQESGKPRVNEQYYHE